MEQTGRSQFIIVSESQELQLGDDAYQETLKKSRPSTRPVAKDDNGIAVIMGHEVAHALARHGAERMSQQWALRRLASYFPSVWAK